MERNILKGLLAFYILCAFLLAGLNYGYAPGAPEKTSRAINTAWHIYENEVKTLLIVVCAFLTLRLEGRNGRIGMRRKNLRGFIVAALVVHLLGPRLLNNPDLYFFAMPLPWTTTAFQLLDPSSPFHAARGPYLGALGIRAAVLFFLGVNLVVFAGTALLGRRWQCSTLCLFNGFAAEIWAPAFPLLGNRTPGRRTLGFLAGLRYLLLGMVLFYTLLWVLRLGGVSFPEAVHTALIEAEVLKYLLLELMLMMFF